jgi:hypothetical protein
MSDKVTVKYFGIERREADKWSPHALIGVVSDATYADVREVLGAYEHLRIVPVTRREQWKEVFASGRLLELNMLTTAIEILCIK